MAVAVRWAAVPVSWAETSSPALTPPMPCTLPVIVVALVTAAVTEGPAPPIVIDVRLTASTRPVRRIRSVPADAGALGAVGAFGAAADTLGAAAPATLAGGVPLIKRSPT